MKYRHNTLRQASTGILLAAAALLAGCWWSATPAKINSWIDEGNPEKALTEVTKQLEANPQSAALNLLGAKARLVLCAQNSCTLRGNGATLLQPVAGMLAKAGSQPILLEEKNPQSKLTSQQVVAAAMPGFTQLPNQPKPLLMLLQTLPSETRPLVANAIYQPALTQARTGHYAQAATYLTSLNQYPELGQTPLAFAQALAGMFSNQPKITEGFIIQLRSADAKQVIPGGEMALLPWALLAQNKYANMGATGASVLESLPTALESWQLGHLMSLSAREGLAEELNAIRTQPALLERWSDNWPAQALGPNITLQRLSLNLNPNQPQVWASYLPAFVQAVSGSTAGVLDGLAMSTISATTMSAKAQQNLAAQLLQTARQLVDKPAAATPLLTFAGSFSLTTQQKDGIDKLAQDLLLKASEQADVTSTLSLALFRPEVAQANRQSVLPLLVANIRRSLHTGAFNIAVNTADTLTNKLKMDIELAPIIIEEFAVEMKDRKMGDQLFADSPEYLLKPEEEARLDIGPLFTFMRSYFTDKPDVVTAQLTTLVAGAQGTYGPATAMYRLGWLFPEKSDQTPGKRQDWINRALTEELLGNKQLSGPQLAQLAAQLAQSQPGLLLGPILAEAVHRASTMEENRQIWHEASTNTRQLLETTHPQYSAFMRALDAQDAGRLNSAASAFAELTTPQWQSKAAPYVLVFQKRLADLVGTYVPVSADPLVKAAAVIVRPLGLEGQPLNQVELTFINRLGTHSQEDPTTYINTPARIVRTTFTAPINFDDGTIAITPQVLALLPQAGNFAELYGNITQLAFGNTQNSNVLNLATNGQPVAYTRVTAAATQPLRPDGTYLVQSGLNAAQEGTETILPPGALLHFTTLQTPQPPLPEWGLTTPVYPLEGDIAHPASTKPIPFTGFFDPFTLALQFSFSYPLPHSGQPVKAAVRCQALAGPIVCGSHHLHSPRRLFATLVAGMQTKESLAQQAEERANANTEARTNLLNALQAAALSTTSAQPATTLTSSPTAVPEGTTQAPAIHAVPTVPTSTAPSATTVSATAVSPSTPVSVTPTTVIVPPGQPISKTDIAPGTFIHRTTEASPTSAASPTTR